ncbi:MAG TPA: FAD-dependent oxidoreductase [Labilithrix sp.]|nr:FAD-dependent oxidoreductase [Labilithrix sp.]
MKRIAVVGGGLTGLTVAYRLGLAGHEVTVYEASERLGGQLSTAREDGWIVELGAEGFVARSEAVPRLATDLARTNDAVADDRDRRWLALLDQTATTSFRFDGRELRALAPGEAAEALSFQVAPSARGAGIRTFAGGMQTLADALAIAVRARSAVHLAQPVESLEVGAAGVRIGGVAHDAVVLATSSAAAARLLVPVLGETELARAETLSSVTVSLGYDARSVRHALAGTGFVVGEPFEGFRACTFTSSKFAHRAPEGAVSLRVFFRPTEDELQTDTPWERRAASVLGRVLPIDGAPLRSWVSRWPRALPVFSAEHRALVARVEETLGVHGIHLAGSAFHGSGIDAAVLSAEAVAARLA